MDKTIKDETIKDSFIDPRNKSITLYEKTWSRHILTNHVNIKNHYNELRETIENPDKIVEGRNPPTEELYIKTFPHMDMAVATRDMTTNLTIVTTAYSDIPNKNWSSKGNTKWKK